MNTERTPGTYRTGSRRRGRGRRRIGHGGSQRVFELPSREVQQHYKHIGLAAVPGEGSGLEREVDGLGHFSQQRARAGSQCMGV